MAKNGVLQIKILGDSKPLEKTLKGIGGKLRGLGVAAVAAGATAAVGLAAFSIKTFADFDQAMTASTAIMGDLTDAMRNDMAGAARDVAKTTAFSATEAAESYFFLASAGMDAAASIGALPKVAAFAQAGAFDMATATDLLTDAQSALGLVVDDTTQNLENMSRVGDVLVKANTLANASVEQFSEALTEKAGTALRQLNKDVEEGVAVLSVYADAGVKGGAAGTRLNAVLEGLTRTARTNADAYDDLGVSVFDADGEMRNMADIVGDLETSLDGMSTEQQLAELSALGLTRQARDGTVALLGTSGAIREYEAGLRDASGITGEVADKQLQTFWAQLGLVKDNLLDVALSIGEALMPALMGFVEWLQGNLPAITAWFDRVSTKFNDLLGVSGDMSQGMITHLDGLEGPLSGMDNNVRQAMVGAGASMDNLKGPLDHLDANVVNAMVGVEDATAQFRAGADDNFSEAGTFMERMSNAWKVVWEDDIKPWLMDTMLPWLEEVFFPALIRAFVAAGGAAGRGFLSGLSSIIDQQDNPALAGVRNLFNTIEENLANTARNLTGRGPRREPAPGGWTPRGGVQEFHDGGIVPGRRGQEVPILAMAGETVYPTHKTGGRNMGGVHVENLYVGSVSDGRAMNKELRKLAVAASYG